MKDYIEKRCVAVSKHIIKTGDTVRKASKVFGVTKSTIFKDATDRISQINPSLAKEVKKTLIRNKEIRALRGGEATKKLWEAILRDGKK